MAEPLSLQLPPELVEQIATRVAELILPRLAFRSELASPWLDVDEARTYLGLSKNALYKLTAAHAIPFRKKQDGQGLRFHINELDQWMRDQYPRLDHLAY
jgi:excisionase family DNA binding protein